MAVKVPTWYPEPKLISIKVDPSKTKVSPLGNEASVAVTAESKTYLAVVPIDVIDQGTSTVRAAQIGEVGSQVLLTFAPTSMGTSTWSIPQATLEKLIHGTKA